MPILTSDQIAAFRTSSAKFADDAQATLDAYLAAVEEPPPPSTLPIVQPIGRLYGFTTGFVGWNVSWDRAGYPAARTAPQQCAAIPQLLDRLAYTKVKLIRVGWTDPTKTNFCAFRQVADAGMKMIMVKSGPFANFASMQTGFAHIIDLVEDKPSSVYSIEGINEYHTLSTQPPPSYRDRNGITHPAGSDAAKVKHQEDLYFLANNNPATANIPITRFTHDQPVDNGESGCDYGNVHPYPKCEGESSQEGLTSLLPRRIRDIYSIRLDEWNKPVHITESGWTSPILGHGLELDFDTHALCLQHAIYDAYRLGAAGIWVYELDNGDEGRPTQGFFGAYDRTGNSYSSDGIGYTATAKKAAHVMHNWMTALGDTNPTNFLMTGLPMKATGLGPLDEWMLFQHSDGSYRLLLIKRDDFWRNKAPLNPAPSNISLEVPTDKQVAVCIPQDSETFTTLERVAPTYNIVLTKKPVVVRIQ
jgi:hypothetical protein